MDDQDSPAIPPVLAAMSLVTFVKAKFLDEVGTEFASGAVKRRGARGLFLLLDQIEARHSLPELLKFVQIGQGQPLEVTEIIPCGGFDGFHNRCDAHIQVK